MTIEQANAPKPILIAIGHCDWMDLLEEQDGDRYGWRARILHAGHNTAEEPRIMPVDFTPLATLVTSAEVEPVVRDLSDHRPGEGELRFPLIVEGVRAGLAAAILKDASDINITHSQLALEEEVRQTVRKFSLRSDHDIEAAKTLLLSCAERGRALVREVNGRFYRAVEGRFGALYEERDKERDARRKPRLFGFLPPADINELRPRSDPATALRLLFWQALEPAIRNRGEYIPAIVVGSRERPLIEGPLIEQLLTVFSPADPALVAGAGGKRGPKLALAPRN